MRRALRHRFPVQVAVLLGSTMSSANGALACPDCATARVVRGSVLDGRFHTNLMLISLPLIVLAVIVALLYRIGFESRLRTETAKEEDRTS